MSESVDFSQRIGLQKAHIQNSENLRLNWLHVKCKPGANRLTALLYKLKRAGHQDDQTAGFFAIAFGGTTALGNGCGFRWNSL